MGCHDLAYPTLRGVSEVLDALSCGIQSVSEWVLPCSDSERNLPGVDVVLFVRHTCQFEPVEVG